MYEQRYFRCVGCYSCYSSAKVALLRVALYRLALFLPIKLTRAPSDWITLHEIGTGVVEVCRGGIRLLPVRGLETTTCHHLLSAELEALVAAYPSGLPIESRSLRRVNTLLQRHGIDWRVERQDGVAVLLQTTS